MKDIRDQRDPTALGQALIDFKGADTAYPNTNPMSVLHDSLERGGILYRGEQIPNYDPSETMVQSTVRTRQQELRDRAARGDKYAISMLETGQPGDSDE